MTDELGVAWNGKGVRARGIAVIFALCVIAIIASNMYGVWRLEEALLRANGINTKGHATISVGQERLACVVTMTMEQRERFRSEYRPGAFQRWCPWMTDDDDRGIR